MELMDSSALALALPTIARHFAVPVIDLKFALTAYFVTVAVLVPTSGWLASRFGPRRVFLTAMMVFMAGSACCGMAANVPQLVGARILQGIGGSMMTPVGRLIMVSSVPRHKLVQAMAWYTLPAIMAPLIGPPLAGFLIEYANWRWIFFINLPVGLIGLVAVVRLVPVVAGTRRGGLRRAGVPAGGGEHPGDHGGVRDGRARRAAAGLAGGGGGGHGGAGLGLCASGAGRGGPDRRSTRGASPHPARQPARDVAAPGGVGRVHAAAAAAAAGRARLFAAGVEPGDDRRGRPDRCCRASSARAASSCSASGG